VTRLDVMVRELVAEGRSPDKSKKPWKNSYKVRMEDERNRNVREHVQYRALDVDRALCDSMRAQGGTPRLLQRNTAALRAFLRWGHEKGYFTATQAEVLPEGCSSPAASILGTEVPERRRRARHVGEHEEYVRERRRTVPRPGHQLARGVRLGVPGLGALSVELGSNSGPRLGKEFQLTACDVHFAGCPPEEGQERRKVKPHIHIDWQIDPGTLYDARARRADPAVRDGQLKAEISRIWDANYLDRDTEAEQAEHEAARQAE
jgi:hypothetical protein